MEIWKEKQHQKLVVIFFRCKTFAPNIKHFFRVYITYLNTRRVGRIRDSYANPRLRLGYAQLSRILPAHECLDESMRTPKKCPIAVHLSTNKTARSSSVYLINYHNCLSNCVTTLSSAKIWNTFATLIERHVLNRRRHLQMIICFNLILASGHTSRKDS